MFVFRKIWRALFSRNTRFEIRPFALLPTYYGRLIYNMVPDYINYSETLDILITKIQK